MWDDVVIGCGQRGNSAVKVFGLGCDIEVSQNSASYWISDCYLGLGMTVFKDTPEGHKLSEMIAGTQDGEALQSWLEGVLLKHVSQEQLKAAVEQALSQAFQRGRATKAAEMRAVLDL